MVKFKNLVEKIQVIYHANFSSYIKYADKTMFLILCIFEGKYLLVNTDNSSEHMIIMCYVKTVQALLKGFLGSSEIVK